MQLAREWSEPLEQPAVPAPSVQHLSRSLPWIRPRKRKGDKEKCSPQMEWCPRHHVVGSRRNVALPPDRRVFFDVLPQLRVREGEYTEVPLHAVGDVDDDPGRFRESLQWKWMQYPEISRSCTGSLASSRASLPLLPAQRTEPEGSDASCHSSPPQKSVHRVRHKSPERKATKVASVIHGPPELTSFVRWCEAKHGHLINTWRQLDADGNMILSKAEFMRGVGQMGYEQDAQTLWSTFHLDENDMLSFIKFVPDLAIDLARFKHWAEETFGCIGGAFRAFDTNCKGKLSYKEFLLACERFVMPQRLKDIVHSLFVMLDDGAHKASRGQITEEELSFLERWQCPPYLWAEPDFTAKKDFWKELLAHHKDNALIAWRKAVDRDGNMSVSYAEFYKACAKLMRSGALGKHSSIGLVNSLFTTFDPYRSGYISLRRWDYHTYQLLMNFTLWARRSCSKASDFVKVFQPEPGAGVSLGSFRKATQSLAMKEDDSRLLFCGLSLTGASIKSARISQDDLLFLDKWDPDKMQQEDHAWEKMVGGRFGTHHSNPDIPLQAKRLPNAISAVKKMRWAMTLPSKLEEASTCKEEVETGKQAPRTCQGLLSFFSKSKAEV